MVRMQILWRGGISFLDQSPLIKIFQAETSSARHYSWLSVWTCSSGGGHSWKNKLYTQTIALFSAVNPHIPTVRESGNGLMTEKKEGEGALWAAWGLRVNSLAVVIHAKRHSESWTLPNEPSLQGSALLFVNRSVPYVCLSTLLISLTVWA